MRASKRAISVPDGPRAAFVAAGLLGVAALLLATFTTVIAITVGTTSRLARLDTALSGWDRHGPALPVVAGLALVMVIGAARGAAPAAVAVVVCGVAALLIALAFDAPRLDDAGQVGRLYADASAGPGVGFWLELGGGLLLAASGAGLLLLAPRSCAPVDRSLRRLGEGNGSGRRSRRRGAR